MHLVYPRVKKNCITIVSNFSWVLQSSLEKSKTMVMQFFLVGGWGGGGENKVHYGLCENGEWCFICPIACMFLQLVVLYHMNDQLHWKGLLLINQGTKTKGRLSIEN